mmetsp:Transcript_9103/g.30162  ORF Transcript_9103/g.30162 Transcript_9103/m.30162 type:complete len:288 (+) Transcript_9103:2078-2941(+)
MGPIHLRGARLSRGKARDRRRRVRDKPGHHQQRAALPQARGERRPLPEDAPPPGVDRAQGARAAPPSPRGGQHGGGGAEAHRVPRLGGRGEGAVDAGLLDHRPRHADVVLPRLLRQLPLGALRRGGRPLRLPPERRQERHALRARAAARLAGRALRGGGGGADGGAGAAGSRRARPPGGAQGGHILRAAARPLPPRLPPRLKGALPGKHAAGGQRRAVAGGARGGRQGRHVLARLLPRAERGDRAPHHRRGRDRGPQIPRARGGPPGRGQRQALHRGGAGAPQAHPR